jgi:hypothetical protein
MNDILIDPEDEWILSVQSWSVRRDGYVICRVRGNNKVHMYLHHAIMGCPIWDREEIDHINRNPSDNRRSNLRWTTHSQNLINNGQALGQTGVRGTTRNADGKYRAQIKRNGINHYLGSYATLDEAVAARDKYLQVVSTDTI